MARTNDPNSATSQFFVNLVDSSFLDYTGKANPGYTVFGKVTDGIETIDEEDRWRGSRLDGLLQQVDEALGFEDQFEGDLRSDFEWSDGQLSLESFDLSRNGGRIAGNLEPDRPRAARAHTADWWRTRSVA